MYNSRCMRLVSHEIYYIMHRYNFCSTIVTTARRSTDVTSASRRYFPRATRGYIQSRWTKEEGWDTDEVGVGPGGHMQMVSAAVRLSAPGHGAWRGGDDISAGVCCKARRRNPARRREYRRRRRLDDITTVYDSGRMELRTSPSSCFKEEGKSSRRVQAKSTEHDSTRARRVSRREPDAQDETHDRAQCHRRRQGAGGRSDVDEQTV